MCLLQFWGMVSSVFVQQHDPIIRSASGIERFQYNIGWKTEGVLLRIDAKHLLVWRIISTLKTSRSSSHNYFDNNTTNIIILLCINVFFCHFRIFFSSGRGSFRVLSAPWHAGSPLGHWVQVWALADVPRAARALGF